MLISKKFEYLIKIKTLKILYFTKELGLIKKINKQIC